MTLSELANQRGIQQRVSGFRLYLVADNLNEMVGGDSDGGGLRIMVMVGWWVMVGDGW